MITIADTLTIDHVLLELTAPDPQAAIDTLARALRNDQRVQDWPAFHKALRAHPPCRIAENSDFGICIPHARTNAVTGMVMSAGRLRDGMCFPECTKPIRYVFCIAVPQSLASDYLRIAGALMRIFTDEETEQSLRTAVNPVEFVDALTHLERKLT